MNQSIDPLSDNFYEEMNRLEAAVKEGIEINNQLWKMAINSGLVVLFLEMILLCI